MNKKQNSNFFFSIIVPTYNSINVIHSCLDSLSIQIFKDFEVVIVDGNSKDNTQNVVAKFQNKLNINFCSEQDAGIYDAYNKGIERAKGEWLLFLGSDDMLYNEKVLERVYSLLNNADTEMAYGNVEIVGDSLWWYNGQIYGGEFSLRRILGSNICHQAIFYKKSLFERIGNYNLLYPVCADYDMNLRCFVHTKPKYFDLIISYYTAEGASTTTHDPVWIDNKDYIIIDHFKKNLFKKEFIGFKYLLLSNLTNKYKKYSLGRKAYFICAFAVLMLYTLIDKISRKI